MKIQRHVRQDFQPAYIKLETLDEVKALRIILGQASLDKLTDAQNDMTLAIVDELESIIEAGGIIT